MSWSSWSESITKIAREAQRGIDKVLDITEEEAQAQQHSDQLQQATTNEIEEPKIEHNEPPETPKPKKKETNGWNNDAWDDDFDVEPVKPVKKVKKLSPRASLKQKKEEKLKRQKSAEKVVEPVPPPPEPKIEPPVEPAVEVTKVEVQEEPAQPEPVPVVPEPVATPVPVVEVVQPVSQLVNETRNSDMENESKEAIIALVEHAEALGNSFQLLNTRLVSREEQLVKLSTSNAELAAKNDDLVSQIEFYKEQSEANGDLDQQNQSFRNKIQECS